MRVRHLLFTSALLLSIMTLATFCTAVCPTSTRNALEKKTPLGALLNRQELRQLARIAASTSIGPRCALPDSPFYFVIHGAAVLCNKEGARLCAKTTDTFFIRNSSLDAAGDGTGLGMLTTVVAGDSGARVLHVHRDQWASFVSTQCSIASRDAMTRFLTVPVSTQLSETTLVRGLGMSRVGLCVLSEICHYATFERCAPLPTDPRQDLPANQVCCGCMHTLRLRQGLCGAHAKFLTL